MLKNEATADKNRNYLFQNIKKERFNSIKIPLPAIGTPKQIRYNQKK